MKKIVFILTIILLSSIIIYFINPNSTRDFKTYSDLDIRVNSNTDSNVVMLVKTPSDEGLIAYTKDLNWEKIVDKVVIQTSEKDHILIDLGDNQLPETLQYSWTEVSFSNYKETTVDIHVRFNDGSTKDFKNSPLNLPKLTSSNLFIPNVFAAMPYWEFKNYWKPTKTQNTQGNVNNWIYYSTVIWTTVNVVSCGIWLWTILFSGWASSPLAYLWCAALIARTATNITEYNGKDCSGDIIVCTTEELKKEVFRKNPKWILGTIKDLKTNGIIEWVNIKATIKNGNYSKTIKPYKWDYALYHLDIWATNITASADEYQTRNFRVAIQENRTKIVDVDNWMKTLVDTAPSENYVAKFNFTLTKLSDIKEEKDIEETPNWNSHWESVTIDNSFFNKENQIFRERGEIKCDKAWGEIIMEVSRGKMLEYCELNGKINYTCNIVEYYKWKCK